jgi:thiamine biosynthesis protein ThiS
VPAIVLNGEPHDFGVEDGSPPTVARLVARLGLEPLQIAVERNREILARSTYADTVLQDGDQLEIVTFVGGG